MSPGLTHGYYNHMVFVHEHLIKANDELLEETRRHNKASMIIIQKNNEKWDEEMTKRFGELPTDWSHLFVKQKETKEPTN